MSLSARETATVLAALRYWQQDLSEQDDADDSGIIDHCGFFDEVAPLTVEEIDDLCERLNEGG